MSFKFIFEEAGHIVEEIRTIYDATSIELLEAYMQARRAHPKARLIRYEQIRR